MRCHHAACRRIHGEGHGCPRSIPAAANRWETAVGDDERGNTEAFSNCLKAVLADAGGQTNVDRRRRDAAQSRKERLIKRWCGSFNSAANARKYSIVDSSSQMVTDRFTGSRPGRFQT